jgi:6-pyruvoyltetrahydropterin/6-carboxytetrahydropterin synthase
VADFFVSSDSQDSVGRVIDFSDLKTRCKDWLDQHWDHSFLIYEGDHNAVNALKQVKPCRLFTLPYNPTAENMAKYLLEVAAPQFMAGADCQVVRVRIWETEDSYAEAALPSCASGSGFADSLAGSVDI